MQELLHVIIQCTAYTDCCSRVGNLILIVLTPKADNFYSSKRIDTCLGESALLLISNPKRNIIYSNKVFSKTPKTSQRSMHCRYFSQLKLTSVISCTTLLGRLAGHNKCSIVYVQAKSMYNYKQTVRRVTKHKLKKLCHEILSHF